MKPHTRIALDLSGIVLREPDIEVQEGEEVIGEFPELLRQLYSLDMELSERHTALHALLPPYGEPEQHPDPAVAEEHRAVHATQSYVRRLIVENARALMTGKDTPYDSFMPRKGWKMVGMHSAPSAPVIVLGVGGFR